MRGKSIGSVEARIWFPYPSSPHDGANPYEAQPRTPSSNREGRGVGQKLEEGTFSSLLNSGGLVSSACL